MNLQHEIVKKSLDHAFEKHDLLIIEKETSFIFLSIFQAFMRKFTEQISFIKGDLGVFSLNPAYLQTKEHAERIYEWLNRLEEINEFEDSDFGKLKIDLEEWYYKIGGQQFIVGYNESYLLNISEAAQRLNISKPTLYKYMAVGLECLDTRAQKKIPAFVIDLWNDPAYMLKMQRNHQMKQSFNQSPEKRYKEILEEIGNLELKYKSDFKGAFYTASGDDLEDWDESHDYRIWQDLLEEKADILRLMKREG